MRLHSCSRIAIAVSLALACGQAMAQAYPSKPVRLIAPFPPGGTSDVLSRLLAQRLSDMLGRQVVVENRPGAGSNLGHELAAKAPADGYTMLLSSNTALAANRHLYKRLGFDPDNDFAPISIVARSGPVLVVHPSVPAKSVSELIALAKARPGQLNFGSGGRGTPAHYAGEILKSSARINIVHVPYKGGVPQVTALVSGETQSSLATISTVIAHIQNGKLRPLGVSSAKPTKVLPGIPTISESGVPGYEMAPWIGVFAPAGTPKNIVERLNAEVNKALAQPDIVQKLESQALDPWPSTPEEFSARLKTDFDKYAKLIRLSGAKIE